ncbi:MAG: PA0069 family radical SAM protein [Gammaproteobacteria bacterium]
MIPFKGRGAVSNDDGRYEAHTHVAIDDGWGSLDEEPRALKTTVTNEAARTIISRNASPDVPFDRSINPYRGCEHGCIYCFARPTHAYQGLSPGRDFESRLFAKPDAARLLAEELRKPNYDCQVIALGANTDCYQPIERERRITRSVLEVLAAHQHPVAIVTKSALVERDIDILASMAKKNLVTVYVSVTTLDRSLARRMEPRAAAPQRRIETIRALHAAGIPTGVLTAPVIPALNDHEMEAILKAANEAGARWAGYVFLRLPLEIKDLFKEWLTVHAPLRAEHVMSLIRQARDGKEYDANFGTRMRGTGIYADMIDNRFHLACKRLGLNQERLRLDTRQFCVPVRGGDQLTLF